MYVAYNFYYEFRSHHMQSMGVDINRLVVFFAR